MPILRYLKMRLELRQIAKAQRDLDAKGVPESPYELDNYTRTSDSIYEWRQLVLTRYWESKAASLSVPLPDWTDRTYRGWVDVDNDERQPCYLTPAGIAKLRADIREEQKHLREVAAFWLSAFIGLIGALTGLAAVVLK